MGLPLISGEFSVTQEPELRFNTDGQAWLKLRCVAKDRAYDADSKEWKDVGEPCYIDILISGKAAENTYNSVRIGTGIVVSGKLHYREWETNEGVKRNTHQIRATSIGPDMRFGERPEPGQTQQATVPTVQDDDAPF